MVGVIVRIERDAFHVLDTNGNVQIVKLQEMGRKRTSTVGVDKNQNKISANDVVNVLDPKSKVPMSSLAITSRCTLLTHTVVCLQQRQGTVKHIHRFFAFLHSKDLLEHSGIFVVRTNNCSLVGGNKSNRVCAQTQTQTQT
jgi:transcription elongation factor SPT5